MCSSDLMRRIRLCLLAAQHWLTTPPGVGRPHQGWAKLALQLYNDPKTDRTTIFYKTWIEANVDTTQGEPQMASSAVALSGELRDLRCRAGVLARRNLQGPRPWC